MTVEPLSGELHAFAEDSGAFVAIGPREERILTNRYSVTFTPGEHFWSASVQRLRLGRRCRGRGGRDPRSGGRSRAHRRLDG